MDLNGAVDVKIVVSILLLAPVFVGLAGFILEELYDSIMKFWRRR